MKVKNYDISFCGNFDCKDAKNCERNILNYETFESNRRVSFLALLGAKSKEDCELFIQIEEEEEK